MTPPDLILPEPLLLFRKRAVRFRQLADRRPFLARYLNLLADLSEGQDSLVTSRLHQLPGQLLRDTVDLDVPVACDSAALRSSLRYLAATAGSEQLADLPRRLEAVAHERLDDWVDAYLSGNIEQLDPAIALYLGAALQIHWALQASRLEASALSHAEPGYRCPACGFLPVAAVLQTGGGVQGLRYLVCGLCASRWNRPRIQCIHCGASEHVAYFGIEGEGEAVRAEACADCMTYIKLMNQDKDGQVDPFADDLASLPLDLLMAEGGYQRLGFNPLLIPG